MEWPAGLASKMLTVQAYARAFQLHKLYGHKESWADNNPQHFRLVTQVWRWRKDAGLNPF